MADIKVYGTLRNATKSGKVAYAEQVFDEALNKMQSNINAENTGNNIFRYAHWNVGHFGFYDGNEWNGTPITSPEDSDAVLLRFKKMFNEINPAIFGVCEDDPVFDTANRSTLSDLYCYFNIKYQGTKYVANCNSIYANLPIAVDSVTEVVYPNGVQTRYYKLMVATWKGQTIKIVETHLDFNQGEHGGEYRAEQIAALIDAFADDQYVIISGDFNIGNTGEYDAFLNAGFSMANHGYLDDIITWVNRETLTGKGFDNIICKGFKITNTKVWEESFNLSDHAAIACDLEMIV